MEDYGRLMVGQRAQVLVSFAEMKCVTFAQRRLWTIFRTRCTRAKKTALRLCTQFEEEGSVKNEKRPRTLKVRSLAAEDDTLCGEPAQLQQINKEGSSCVCNDQTLSAKYTSDGF